MTEMATTASRRSLINLPLLSLSSQAQERLKLFAITLMVLDHFARINHDFEWLHYPGRLVFPIFAYLLVYNYIYRTSKKTRYLAKLFIFALISQPVYIYAFGTPFDFLNILFSLFFGLVFIATHEYFARVNEPLGNKQKRMANMLWLVIAFAAFIGIGMYLSYFWFGMAMILAFYMYLKSRSIATFVFLLLTVLLVNLPSGDEIKMLAGLLFLPVVMFVASRKDPGTDFNRLRGVWFYLFYPAHLFVLKLLSLFN